MMLSILSCCKHLYTIQIQRKAVEEWVFQMVLISVGAIIFVVFIVWPFISATDVRRTIAGRWAEGSPIG